MRERLDAAVESTASLREPIHVALDAHLSIAWYTGYLIDPKAGKRVVLQQRVKGTGIELWDVSSPRKPAGAETWTMTHTKNGDGGDLAIVVSVTHPALTDAARFAEKSLPSVGSIVHAELPLLGPQALQDGGHARWLADELIRKLSVVAAELRPAHVHLFLACPASLAFLLGQESRALGPTTAYEFAFGQANRTYRPGMTTATEHDV
jgi:hypothetical protein